MEDLEEEGAALGGLRHLRKMRNWSQKDMADSMGLEAKNISRYESDEILPRLTCLRQMCRILKCELWQLFFDPERHGKAA